MKVYEVTGTVLVELTPDECAILAKACYEANRAWPQIERVPEANVAFALQGGFEALTVAAHTRARMLENEATDLQETVDGLGLLVDTRIGPKGRHHVRDC